MLTGWILISATLILLGGYCLWAVRLQQSSVIFSNRPQRSIERTNRLAFQSFVVYLLSDITPAGVKRLLLSRHNGTGHQNSSGISFDSNDDPLGVATTLHSTKSPEIPPAIKVRFEGEAIALNFAIVGLLHPSHLNN